MPPVNLYTTPIYLPGPVVGGKANLPVVSTVQAVQTNPTTFENSNDVLTLGQPTLTHYSAQFGFTNADQNTGLDLQMVLQSHLTQLEKSVQAAINAQITEANFAAATVTVTSGNWAVANFEALRAAVPSATAVCLAADYFVKTKSTWMPAGTEGTLRELSDLTGIGSGIKGFVARPEALALVIGYPTPGPVGEVTVSKINLPVGIPVQFSRWWQRGGRSWRGSLDIVLGVEVGQPGALRLLKTA